MKNICSKALGLVVLSGVSLGANAAWVDPTAGWDFEYEASSGLRLNELAVSPWVRAGYVDATTPLEVDAVDPARDVMHLFNFPNDASFGGNFNISTGIGEDDGSGLLTADVSFRLRVTEAENPDGNQDQFAFYVRRNDRLYIVRFARNRITYTDGNAFLTTAATIGNEWHDFRLLIDSNTDTASLYLDNSADPAIASFNGLDSAGSDVLILGDGTSGVAGAANLESLRVTNGELAVVPEPGVMSLLCCGSILMLNHRRRKAAS